LLLKQNCLELKTEIPPARWISAKISKSKIGLHLGVFVFIQSVLFVASENSLATIWYYLTTALLLAHSRTSPIEIRIFLEVVFYFFFLFRSSLNMMPEKTKSCGCFWVVVLCWPYRIDMHISYFFCWQRLTKIRTHTKCALNKFLQKYHALVLFYFLSLYLGIFPRGKLQALF